MPKEGQLIDSWVETGQQADEGYKPGMTIRMPTTRGESTIQSGEYVRPCPHCIPGNYFGWQCPNPVPDPTSDPEHAWPMDDGSPPGHASCGNCENLLATGAPTTSKCDICQVYFCGISVQHRCIAVRLANAHPQGMSDISDLVRSTEVYERFDGNAIEVEIMLDYLGTQHISPRHIYGGIVQYILSRPREFAPLIGLDLFVDVHSMPPGPEPGLDASRQRICRTCAAEVLLYGLKDWWIRERKRGGLDPSIAGRPDCPDGAACRRQKEHAHAKEFNHVFDSAAETLPEPLPAAYVSTSSVAHASDGNVGVATAAVPGPSFKSQAPIGGVQSHPSLD